MQAVDLVHHRAGVQACIAVLRVGFIHGELQRQWLAHREVASAAVFARQVAAPLLIRLGVVLDDEAARAPHHVQANQLAPIIELVALLDGENRVGLALVLALELRVPQTELSHVVLGADADVGLLVDEQPQLAGQIGLGLVVGRGGQQDDLGVATADVVGNRLVASALTVSQVVALVDQHEPVAFQVRQLSGHLADWQHHATQAVFGSVALPHRLQVLGADDEGLVTEVVLEHSCQGRGHHGLAQAHHVTDHHAAAPVQVAGGDLDGTLLELEQVLLEACGQPELAQPGTRLGAQVEGDVEVNVVRRNSHFSRPAGFDDGGQVGRDV